MIRLILIIWTGLAGFTTQADWAKGLKAYQSNHLSDALEEFKKDPAPTNPNYYYNLGVIHLEMNDFGAARAYLERAKILNPNDSNTSNHLSDAISKMRVTQGGALDNALSWPERLVGSLPMEETLAILGIINFLLALVVITRGIRSNFKSAARSIFGIFWCVGVLASATLVGSEQYVKSETYAVTLSTLDVHSGPGPEHLEIAQVPPGTKVKLIDDPSQFHGGVRWVRVRYQNSERGFVQLKGLLLL